MSTPSTTSNGRYSMSTKAYDLLKDVAQLYLPAAGTLYASLAAIWNWGFVTEITGTVLAVDLFLGAVLKLSKISYDNSDKSKDGELSLTVSRNGLSANDVLLDTPLSELANKDRVVLNVETESLASGMDPRLLDNSQE